MQELTKQEAHKMFFNGTRVEVSKKPTHVFARWVENYDLCTKASGTVENERKNVTGWLVQPQHDKKKFVVFIAEDITFPDHWEGGDFTLLAGGVLVDNGDNSVYGINPVEFWETHERLVE